MSAVIGTAVLVAIAVFFFSRSLDAKSCDRYGAHPHDSEAVTTGVKFDRIDTALVIAVCSRAVKQYPQEPRYQFQLGRAYHAIEDFDAAKEAYEAAAVHGYVAAMVNLGFLLAEDQKAERDIRKGFEWFRKAAQEGAPEAYTYLGGFHEYGIGIPRDLDEAQRLYREGANQGSNFARNELAGFLIERRGTKSDIAEAIDYLEASVSDGDFQAAYMLGFLYLTDTFGVEDEERSREYFGQALDRQIAEARRTYSNVPNFTDHLNKANTAEWFAERFKYNYEPPIRLTTGIFSTAFLAKLTYRYWDKDQLKDLVDRSGRYRDPSAQFAVGFYHQFGIGTEADPEKALDYYQRVQMRGDLKLQTMAAEAMAQIKLVHEPEANERR